MSKSVWTIGVPGSNSGSAPQSSTSVSATTKTLKTKPSGFATFTTWQQSEKKSRGGKSGGGRGGKTSWSRGTGDGEDVPWEPPEIGPEDKSGFYLDTDMSWRAPEYHGPSPWEEVDSWSDVERVAQPIHEQVVRYNVHYTPDYGAPSLAHLAAMRLYSLLECVESLPVSWYGAGKYLVQFAQRLKSPMPRAVIELLGQSFPSEFGAYFGCVCVQKDDFDPQVIPRLTHTTSFIQCIDLRGLKISDKDLLCLSSCTNLRMLDLSGCECLTDFAVKCLTSKIHHNNDLTSGLCSLTFLNLSHTSIQDTALDDLCKFPRLAFLNMSFTLMSLQGVRGKFGIEVDSPVRPVKVRRVNAAWMLQVDEQCLPPLFPYQRRKISRNDALVMNFYGEEEKLDDNTAQRRLDSLPKSLLRLWRTIPSNPCKHAVWQYVTQADRLQLNNSSFSLWKPLSKTLKVPAKNGLRYCWVYRDYDSTPCITELQENIKASHNKTVPIIVKLRPETDKLPLSITKSTQISKPPVKVDQPSLLNRKHVSFFNKAPIVPVKPQLVLPFTGKPSFFTSSQAKLPSSSKSTTSGSVTFANPFARPSSSSDS